MSSNISRSVVERILISKSLLQPIRFNINTRPTNILLAKYILTAHDAADFAIAAVASHLNCTPQQNDKVNLMAYFDPIKRACKDIDMEGRGYFSQLNTARNAIKHKGVFPNPDDWARTGETTYEYISKWSERFFGKTLDEFDESDLIINVEIKKLFESAKKSYNSGKYKIVFEKLAVAKYVLFKEITNLRDLNTGNADANDSIKLSAYGVNPNEYLQLQEFLPNVSFDKKEYEITWRQEEHGHPGNWRKDAAEFCLKAFLSMVISIQDIEWIPGAIQFNMIYEYEIISLKDNLILSGGGMINEKWQSDKKILNKGDKLRVFKVYKTRKKPSSILAGLWMSNPLMPGEQNTENSQDDGKLHIVMYGTFWMGTVDEKDVIVKCVPQNDPWIQEHFGDLPIIDAEIPIEYE